MPDAAQAAASHDVVQILFYFICTLGGAIAVAFAWTAKYVVLPVRDEHIDYLRKTANILPTIANSLKDIHEVQKDIKDGQKTMTETWKCRYQQQHRQGPHNATG